jgi:hypothetical protein
MAERKSGPVKPPVIDLTAREASDSAAEAPAETPSASPTKSAARQSKAAAAAEARATPEIIEENKAAAEGIPLEDAAVVETAKAQPGPELTEPEAAEPEPRHTPLPPRPPARLAMPWSAISIAAVAGAVIGAGLTYALANWIALPTKAPEFDDPAPALESLADRADGLDGRLTNVENIAKNTQVSLDATLVQIDATTKELRDAIAAIPAQQPADLSGIEQELQTLESRVAAIAAGASSADASALADNLVALEKSLNELTTRVAAIDIHVGQNDATVAGLKTDVEAAKVAIAEQNRTIGGADIGPQVRLPLIVSGLEAAFANGRPFRTELDGLVALLPDISVPAPVTAAAETGLVRPDALADEFEARVPDILAGRTGESTGDWTTDAIEWAKALLALRPAEEIEGDTPEAIVSRLEGAVNRHDFTTAATLLAQLPEPMQTAAGDLGTAIVTHAAAEQFVNGLRAQALADAPASATN